jgi:predicted lipid-binding transport protein (Tim44 family)
MGAMIGSIVPGVGTGIGAVIGGVIGAGKGVYDNWDSFTGTAPAKTAEVVSSRSQETASEMSDPNRVNAIVAAIEAASDAQLEQLTQINKGIGALVGFTAYNQFDGDLQRTRRFTTNLYGTRAARVDVVAGY